MRTTLFLFYILLSSFCFSQTLSLDSGTTRAVVVGISDYQNEDIPDLRFADKDAEAFVTYLKSSAGGKLPDENIKLLINEEATMAAMASELDWLVEVSEEGDKAIIYFSGHGDVEAKTMSQPGFLLTYDSPPKIYIAGSYPLFYLQLIIQTLSTSKNVETLVITDACRAGKLAGSDIGGTQATASNLAKQYANEIKILSCQPDEFSLEGEQWGGGRGAFSYHLIEGLIGLADKNENQQVNLLELENYLETVVPEETAPQSQIPMTVGSKGTKIALVDSDILGELKNLKEKQLPTLAAIESRGIEQTFLASVDSIIQEKYDAFIASLNDDNLLDSEDGKPSTDELYRELINEKSLANLHRFMTRQYATALQNDAQQVINSYLLANPTEMEKRWKGDTTYGRYPRYLGRAAELLGEQHYIYNYLIAKKLYFEGLNLRLEGDQARVKGNHYPEALIKIQEAINLENRAAYFYNELGVLHTRLKSDEKAFVAFEKAIELAPDWGLPYANYSVGLHYSGSQQKAIEYGEKALTLMDDFPNIYNYMAWLHTGSYSWRDKSNWTRRGVELRDDFYFEWDFSSSETQKRKRYEKSIILLRKAIELDSNYLAAYTNLYRIYDLFKDSDSAEPLLRRAMQIDSNNHRVIVCLIDFYFWTIQPYKASKLLDTLEVRFPERYTTMGYFSRLRGSLHRHYFNDIPKAIKAYEKALTFNDARDYTHRQLADIYLDLNDHEKAEKHMLDALNRNRKSLENIFLAMTYYIRMNREEDAKMMFQKIISIKPDYIDAYSKMGNYYMDQRKYREAIEIYKKTIDLFPNDPQVHIGIANAYYILNDKDKAYEHFEKSITSDPESLQGCNYLSYYLWMHGEYEKAEEYANRAFEYTKNLDRNKRVDRYWHLAWIYLETGRLPEALATLRKAEKEFPNARQLLEGLLYFNAFSGELEACRAIANQYSTILPEAKEVVQALELIEKEELEQAISVLEESFNNAAPWDINRKYFLMRLNTQIGNYDKALEWMVGLPHSHFSFQFFERDSLINPLKELPEYRVLMQQRFLEKYDTIETLGLEENPSIYYPRNCLTLAEIYKNQNDYNQANRLFQKITELNRDSLTNEDALYITVAYQELGKIEEAIAICPDSIVFNSYEDYQSASMVLYKSRKYEEAEQLAIKAIEMNTNPHSSANTFGWFLKNHGDYQGAEKYLKKSIALKNDYPHPYANLILLYHSFGENQKAIEITKEGLVENPKSETLQQQKIFFSYYSEPKEQAKLIFEEAAKENPVYHSLWNFLEQIHQKEYAEAINTWKEFEGEIYTWYFVHIYIAALAQSGNMETAVEVMNEQGIWSLNYQLLTTYPLLEPLRKEQAYKDYIRLNFPEKIDLK